MDRQWSSRLDAEEARQRLLGLWSPRQAWKWTSKLDAEEVEQRSLGLWCPRQAWKRTSKLDAEDVMQQMVVELWFPPKIR